MRYKKNLDFFICANALKARLNQTEGRIRAIKTSLLRELEDIKVEGGVKYTEWFVLMKRDKDGNWISVCYDPYADDELEDMPMEDFEVILPIPKPETLKEFDGF